MDFFKSVFSDSETSSPPTQSVAETAPSLLSNPPSNPWAFGSTFLSAIASKSETLLDNYYKDIQEFSSDLKKETSALREAASRAVKELPSRLEIGAAVAQESLEAVGQAIDNVGSSVADIIGNDFSLASHTSFFGEHLNENGENSGDGVGYGKDSNFTEIVKPYCRIDAMIRSLQCSVKTYCEEVEESDYSEWKLGFVVEDKSEEIEKLMEENGVIKEIYDEVVPMKVDKETFWCRYFYKVKKVVKAEEARAMFVKRAISTEEELSWDVDDEDEYNDGNGDLNAHALSDELNQDIIGDCKKSEISHDKSIKKLRESDQDDESGATAAKGNRSVCHENLDERLRCDDKEGSEGKIESDFSIVSSQRLDEDDIGWDEIEAFESGDENRIVKHGSSSSSNTSDLKKRLSGAELEEELTWDI